MIELPGIESALDYLVPRAIKTLQLFVPKDGTPYWGAFSGGKDSCVIKALAAEAGVPVEWHYSVTTIDPPELIAFMREHHKDVAFDKPKAGFFKLMAHKGLPTRRVRWCCELLKETRNPPGRRMLLGIRAAESPRRAAQWKTVTFHRRTHSEAISPILDWLDRDVWAYIRARNLPYCGLYDEGFRRLGCVGCPMAGTKGRLREFTRWPIMAEAWRRSAARYWQRQTVGGQRFASAKAMWDRWLSSESMPGADAEEDCQLHLDMWGDASPSGDDPQEHAGDEPESEPAAGANGDLPPTNR